VNLLMTPVVGDHQLLEIPKLLLKFVNLWPFTIQWR